jgi:predicted Zn-dependent peptidase
MKRSRTKSTRVSFVKVLANYLPAVAELTADMLLNSAFDPTRLNESAGHHGRDQDV